MSKLQNDHFVEASGNLRMMEKKLLSAQDTARLAEAISLADFLRLASQGAEYDFSGLERPEDYMKVLDSALKAVYAKAYQLAGADPEVIDVLTEKYQFHNLKCLLKSRRGTGRVKPPYVYVTGRQYRFEPDETADGGQEEAAPMPAYLAEAMKQAEEEYEEEGLASMLDISADRSMWKRILELCKAMDNDFITRYFRLLIDFTNLKAFMRIRDTKKNRRFLDKCLIDGGLTELSKYEEFFGQPNEAVAAAFFYLYFGNTLSEGLAGYDRKHSFAVLEKLLDDRLNEHVRQAKYVAFGPEILFAWVLNKENEIRQLRLIAAAKLAGLKPDELKERLRDQYV